MSKIKPHFLLPKKYEPTLDIIIEELSEDEEFACVQVLSEFGDQFIIFMGKLRVDSMKAVEEAED